MQTDEAAALASIKAAQATLLARYVLRAWAQWGTPTQQHSAQLPVDFAPSLLPAVVLRHAVGELKRELR